MEEAPGVQDVHVDRFRSHPPAALSSIRSPKFAAPSGTMPARVHHLPIRPACHDLPHPRRMAHIQGATLRWQDLVFAVPVAHTAPDMITDSYLKPSLHSCSSKCRNTVTDRESQLRDCVLFTDFVTGTLYFQRHRRSPKPTVGILQFGVVVMISHSSSCSSNGSAHCQSTDVLQHD